jgi:hypothetical protein
MMRTKTTAIGAVLLLAAAAALLSPGSGFNVFDDNCGDDAAPHVVQFDARMTPARPVTIEYRVGSETRYAYPDDSTRWVEVYDDVSCGTIVQLKVSNREGRTGITVCKLVIDGVERDISHVSGNRKCAVAWTVK